MAFTAVVPVSLNATVYATAGQEFKTGIVKDLSAAAVDLSTWTGLTAKAVSLVDGPGASANSFGTVTGNADGTMNLRIAASDFASAEAGSARLVIVGKPTGGDAEQLLASGTLNVLAI